MAAAYLRLAEQAERNATNDIVHLYMRRRRPKPGQPLFSSRLVERQLASLCVLLDRRKFPPCLIWYKCAGRVDVFTPVNYSEKASEFEDLAAHCSDSILRASYLDLARRFREMASLLGVTHRTKDDDIALAERMVGKTTHHH